MWIVGAARRPHIGDKRTKNHTFTRQNYKQRSIITPPTVKLCLTVKNLTFRRKCGQKWESGKRVGHICLGGPWCGLVGPIAAPAAWRPKCSKRGIVLTKKLDFYSLRLFSLTLTVVFRPKNHEIRARWLAIIPPIRPMAAGIRPVNAVLKAVTR